MEPAALEELIMRATEQPYLRPQLVAALLGSRVAVPLNKGLEDGALPADFKPLTLNAAQGFPVLGVFTTPGKVTPWLKEQPDFQHVLVTAFDWVVAITRPPFGIAVNPGYRYACVLSPDDVVALARDRQSTP